MGDFPINLVSAPERYRFGRVRALFAGIVPLLLCLGLAGAPEARQPDSPAFAVAGLERVPAPPAGTSWAPAPGSEAGLSTLASTDGTRFALRTAGGERTFLPGVNLGGTTPGFQPGELSVSAEQYRRWFAAMGWLGIRVVRTYTIHPPSFYRELARHNRVSPQSPLYLMHGVYPPDESYVTKRNLYDEAVTGAFRDELRDASAAVTGELVRVPRPGRAGGVWDTDVTPWLAGWIIGLELDPYAAVASDERNSAAPGVAGEYFRSSAEASPTERWLAARMEELAGHQAARGLSRPIAFVNWPTTDPLRHPEEPLEQEDLLQLDANHVLPTEKWPGGTFASYHAYPYYPDFQRHEPGLKSEGGDPYAGYLAALRDHHRDMPTMITEFGVPSALGSAHHGPLGRSQGDHSEREAMRIDAELLQVIRDRGLAGGFLFGWADEWFKFTWNTIEHQDPARRQLWHDVLTNEQHFGLLALDAAGPPDQTDQRLLDGNGWPARSVTARVDESYLHLRIRLAEPLPSALSLGFDVLPGLSGAPGPGSGDRSADAVLTLDTVARTGQAHLRRELDPTVLDWPVPDSARGPAPDGWRRFELVVNRPLRIPGTGQELPVELQNAGLLRHGSWDPQDPHGDSRAVWLLVKDHLTVRVPWAFLNFADPSAHRVLTPQGTAFASRISPGVALSVSATGTDQPAGRVTWTGWNRPHYVERLKQGAGLFRDAALRLAG